MFVDGSVVSWTKDGQVISANDLKVLKDDRIKVSHRPTEGVSISISGLKVTDAGKYTCELNLKENVQRITHTLEVEGKLFWFISKSYEWIFRRLIRDGFKKQNNGIFH